MNIERIAGALIGVLIFLLVGQMVYQQVYSSEATQLCERAGFHKGRAVWGGALCSTSQVIPWPAAPQEDSQ